MNLGFIIYVLRLIVNAFLSHSNDDVYVYYTRIKNDDGLNIKEGILSFYLH